VIWMNLIQIINVIDSINLEHDGRPKTASHFSASCSGIAAG
jgi:alpha-L-arabinofuranosidase